ncbi:unnamed protein product, partial [Symbiodinium microadriaticum]
FALTASNGSTSRIVKHHMLLPHEIFATLHASEHSDLLYGSIQEVREYWAQQPDQKWVQEHPILS